MSANSRKKLNQQQQGYSETWMPWSSFDWLDVYRRVHEAFAPAARVPLPLNPTEKVEK